VELREKAWHGFRFVDSLLTKVFPVVRKMVRFLIEIKIDGEEGPRFFSGETICRLRFGHQKAIKKDLTTGFKKSIFAIS